MGCGREGRALFHGEPESPKEFLRAASLFTQKTHPLDRMREY